MNLVDVHCHLNHKELRDSLDEIIARAKKAGVKAIIVSGTNTLSNQDVLEMAKKDKIIKVSLGIHPIDALGLSEGETGISKQKGKIDLEREFKFIETHKDQIVSIGEVGLDFHWDKSHHPEQRDIFRRIIRFAIRIKKPIVVHTWDAEEECLNILEEEIKNKEIPVVLHCFSGRKSLISKAKNLGDYFSVPPSIVRLGNFQTLVKKVDLKQLLTETDAPWQTPFKGQLNEPAFVVGTVKKIAEIKKISPEEAAEQIWENYQRVFG